MVVVAKPTKEERAAERAKRDEKLPVVHAKNIHWIPSKFSLSAHRAMVEELKRRLGKADTPRLRNTIRSEMRCNSTTLARAKVPLGKKGWTTEIFYAKHACISVFISAKGHRYVLATRDGPADLIVQNKSRHVKVGLPYCRLLRFEKSPFARMVKKDKQEAAVHSKRTKAKKEKRLKKRQKPTLL